MANGKDTHIIKRVIYDISTSERDNAENYQSKISQLQEHQIQHTLHKVLETQQHPNFRDVYDSIVLDLGTINTAHLEHDLAYKVEEALMAFFNTNTAADGRPLKAKRTVISHKAVHQFIRFLKHGYLDWDSTSNTSIKTLLATTLDADKTQLVNFLNKNIAKAHLRKRLITQCTPKALQQIVLAKDKIEGTYIIDAYQNIIAFHNQYNVIEANTKDFQNAVWDIILAFVFHPTNSVSNQTRFLKHLVYTIAQRYNLSYNLLLTAIAYGIKAIKTQTFSNFERIILELEQHQQKQKTTSNTTSSMDVIATFLFLLDHDALPANSPIKSYNALKKELLSFEKHISIKFQQQFFNHLKTRHTLTLKSPKYIPDDVFYSIFKTLNTPTVNTITAFIKRLVEVAKKENISSNTLQQVEQFKIALLLNTLAEVLKQNTAPVSELMHQIVFHFKLDTAFIKLLQLLKSREDYDVKYISNIVEAHKSAIETSQKKTLHTATQDAVYNTLFTYYKGTKPISSKAFKTKISALGGTYTALKFSVFILELYSKHKTNSQAVLEKWILERLETLKKDEVETSEIIAHVAAIYKMLKVNKTLYKAVTAVKATTEKAQMEAVKANNPLAISTPNYAALLKTLVSSFSERSNSNLYVYIAAILKAFQETHKVTEQQIVKALETQQSSLKTPDFVLQILHHYAKQKSNAVRANSKIIYVTTYLQHYFKTGEYPWWHNDKSKSSFNDDLKLVWHENPNLLKEWLKTSAYTPKIINRLEPAIFKQYITYSNITLGKAIVETYTVFHDILNNDLSGIITVPRTLLETIKQIVFTHAESTTALQPLLVKLNNTIAKTLKISKQDIYLLLVTRITRNAVTSFTNETLTWLKKVSNYETPSFPNSSVLHDFIAPNTNWNLSTAFENKQAFLTQITYIVKTNIKVFYTIAKHLKIREQLVSAYPFKSQKALLMLVFKATTSPSITQVITKFETLKAANTAKDFKLVWEQFLNKVFLRLSIIKNAQWSKNTWFDLYVESIAVIHNITIKHSMADAILKDENLNTNTKNVLDRILKQEKVAMPNENEIPELDMEDNIGDVIYIENAGLVLLTPYVSMLFERIQLVQQGEFKDDACRDKALLALQYAVTGLLKIEEQDIVLNKIICGMSIHKPMTSTPSLSQEETTLIDGMLKAIISHWATIGNTSIAGLRETFLMRSGRIAIEDKKYVLTVVERTYDMLLDQIPWSFRQVKLSYMDKLIEVIWRS